MNTKKTVFMIFIASLLFFPQVFDACTTFCFQYNGDWIYGRNYDWWIEHCLIVVNKRGVAKSAFTEKNPAKWISKYGSVTFNQYGREFPLGGMNEAGLVIECMWLRQTEYPVTDSRPELPELQWMQFHLDTSSTVDEVIASDKKVKITVRNAQPIHFLVCDRKKGSAVIEFIEGRMKAYTGDNLPVSALTNNTYEYSLGLFKLIKGNENTDTFKDANYSLKRFFWAGQGVKNWKPEVSGNPVDYAFKVLEKVTLERTMFSIVYDVKNSMIYFKTKSNPDIRFINVKKFDFSCKTPVKILDMSAELKGDVTSHFTDYTFEANYNLLKKSFQGTSFLKNTPEEFIHRRAGYPEMLPCKE